MKLSHHTASNGRDGLYCFIWKANLQIKSAQYTARDPGLFERSSRQKRRSESVQLGVESAALSSAPACWRGPERECTPTLIRSASSASESGHLRSLRPACRGGVPPGESPTQRLGVGVAPAGGGLIIGPVGDFELEGQSGGVTPHWHPAEAHRDMTRITDSPDIKVPDHRPLPSSRSRSGCAGQHTYHSRLKCSQLLKMRPD
jgi:hypothetical protein